jgi:hypothetical protein
MENLIIYYLIVSRLVMALWYNVMDWDLTSSSFMACFRPERETTTPSQSESSAWTR